MTKKYFRESLVYKNIVRVVCLTDLMSSKLDFLQNLCLLTMCWNGQSGDKIAMSQTQAYQEFIVFLN